METEFPYLKPFKKFEECNINSRDTMLNERLDLNRSDKLQVELLFSVSFKLFFKDLQRNQDPKNSDK